MFSSASIGSPDAVENHVGRIEIDEQIVALDVVDELQQRVGRLLPGFQMQGLAVAAAVIAQSRVTASTSR